MSKMRPTDNRARRVAVLTVAALFVVLFGSIKAEAQVSVSIGINVPVYPRLALVPGYPVYYAPGLRANYFFYDGMYWVFNADDGYWYSSSWYNGPWVFVEPVYVPQFILVVPYRYYRIRPVYWRGWAYDLPPRWGRHWGPEWESRRRGWERWDRTRVYAAAPLPVYQKRYAGGRYPSPAQQVIIHKEQYHYRIQDVHVREQHETILQRQSQGGFKAHGKIERLADAPKGPEKAPLAKKGQSPEKGKFEERGQVQEKGQNLRKGQSRGGPPPHEEKGPHREKGQHQEKAKHPE